MKFVKTCLSISDQINLLESRGMIINDKAKAENYLSNISYYRLSAYWHTFLKTPKESHNFIDNTTFQKVIDTYVFDRRLRLLIFDEIERLEVAIRTQIIYHFGLAYGNNWYEDSGFFKSAQAHGKLNEILAKELRQTSEVFIQHYKRKYTDPINPPCWMALELLSFSQISILYKNLKACDAKKKVAKHFGLHETVLESWLEGLSYIRNTCAHHSRLWNKKTPKTIQIPKGGNWLTILPEQEKYNRIYLSLAAILHLLRFSIPTTSFRQKLITFLNEHPQIPKNYMGFPDKWLEDKFWHE